MPAAASASCRRASRCTTPATPPPNPLSDAPANRLRFPASARLRETGEFAAVRAEGRMVQGRWLRMTALPRPAATDSNDAEPARLGVVTSRRVGPAVQRNRMRRRLRELFRLRRAHFVPGLWLVVTAKPGSGIAPAAEVREEWLRLAKRLSILRDL